MGIVNRILSLLGSFNWLVIPAALISIIFHELAHGWVAYLLGDRTAKEMGRLSLNPLKHIDVVGLLAMIFFGFGWAKPVPVNPYHFKNKKLGTVLVSLAGPLSNLIMAFFALLLNWCILWFFSASFENVVVVFIDMLVRNFLLCLVTLNISLAVFNLIPIPPLDGSKILFSFLPKRAYNFILRYEQYGMILLIVLINLPFFNTALTILRHWVMRGIAFVVGHIIF